MSTEDINESTSLLSSPNTSESSQKVGSRSCLWVMIATIFSILFAVAAVLYLKHSSSSTPPAKSFKSLIDTSYDSVLSDYDLNVHQLSETKISGTFTVEGLTYEFESKSDPETPFLSFKTSDGSQTTSEFCGFKTMNIVSKTELILDFFTTTNNDQQVLLHKNEAVPDETREKLENFFSSKINQHFVQFSYKLASYKLIGKDFQPIMAIYKFAEAILKVADKNKNVVRNDWIDLKADYHKVSQSYHEQDDDTSIRAYKGRGGNKGGNRGGSTQTSPPEMLPTQDTGCSLSNQCGNACFGMCGLDCDCWDWFCGDCQCWPGCLEHDYWCSCDFWTYWYCCINGFGFNCFDWTC